jgi:hypothetical protein
MIPLDIVFFDPTYLDGVFERFDPFGVRSETDSKSLINSHFVNKNLVIDNFDFSD